MSSKVSKEKLKTVFALVLIGVASYIILKNSLNMWSQRVYSTRVNTIRDPVPILVV